MPFLFDAPVTALVIEPGKSPRVETVSFADAKRLVGCFLSTIHLPGQTKILCHMETLLTHPTSEMAPNRKVPPGVESIAGWTMRGTFIVLGSGGSYGEQDRSLTAPEQTKWTEHFSSAGAQP